MFSRNNYIIKSHEITKIYDHIPFHIKCTNNPLPLSPANTPLHQIHR